jgi:hypothetical protein
MGAAEDGMDGARCWVIATVESIRSQTHGPGVTIKLGHFESAGLLLRAKDSGFIIWHKGGMTDDDIKLIENFKFSRGSIFVERRNRGYSLIHGQTGAPVARLRPYQHDNLVEIFYWSLGKQRWAPFGPFGSTVVPVDEALRIIDANAIFWAVI